MDRLQSWLKVPYGKKLKKLHAWNAWIVLSLAVTGILLYVPALRGSTSSIRVALKQVHIGLGIVSIVIILLYLPLVFKHLNQIRKKQNQTFNLGLVLFLLFGWSITGILLWLEKSLPSELTYYSLLLHDLFTWVGVPWVIYHSVTRNRWLKNSQSKQNESKQVDYTRRVFIRLSIGAVLLALTGPYFYRWMKRFSDSGGEALDELVTQDGNRMLPPPIPHPDSLKPLGGGYQGDFRVYTVTPIPSFDAEDWKFSINGLVDRQIEYNWEDFLEIPREVQVSDFHCVTGWSVFDVTWEGIPLADLLALSGVKDRAKFVKFYSGDGVYTDALSLEQAALEDIMVAVMLDGKPIPQKLGGPIRLIVPKMYAYKSVKWLQSLELIENDHIGYWQLRGYDIDAWVPEHKLRS